jgi:hypothetical protein
MKLPSRAALRALAVALLMLALVTIAACDPQSGYVGPDGISGSTTNDHDPRNGSVPVYQRLKRVHEGMTYEEVVRIMDGAPPGSTGAVTGAFEWQDSGGVARITLENGLVTSKTWMGWP